MTSYEIYCEIRDRHGYKDSYVAQCTGITKSTFSDWKSGRYTPKQDKIQRIADFLGVSVEYLMSGQSGHSAAPQLTELEWEVIKAFRQLDESKREVILDILHIQDTEKKKDSAVSA